MVDRVQDQPFMLRVGGKVRTGGIQQRIENVEAGLLLTSAVAPAFLYHTTETKQSLRGDRRG